MIIVGRNGNQAKPITDHSVSREHCSITPNPDGTYTIENLSKSSYTLINGQQILKRTVSADVELQLGPTFRCKLADLLPKQVTHKEQPKPAEIDYRPDFRKLKPIYDKYRADLLEIQKEKQMQTVYKSIPSMLSLVGIAIARLMKSDAFTYFFAVLIIIGILYVFISSKNSAKKDPERIEALNRKFKTDYVCPKCKRWLGDIPFEAIEHTGECLYCKTKFK